MSSISPHSGSARNVIMAAAVAALTLGVGAPAFAGGYVGAGYHGGYYGGGFYAAGYKGYRHRGYHRYHRRHHRGGGNGAAIALGVIGGAIILNELAEDRARDRYYEDRYYRNRYRARDYERGYRDGRYDERRYSERYDDGAYYDDEPERFEDDAAGYDGEAYDDSGLAGGGPVLVTPGNSDYDRAPRRVTAAAAYGTCLDHARRALGERGFVISAPYQPETVEDRGGALLMTATVRARRGGESWARAMSCEASESRVFRMELI